MRSSRTSISLYAKHSDSDLVMFYVQVSKAGLHYPVQLLDLRWSAIPSANNGTGELSPKSHY